MLQSLSLFPLTMYPIIYPFSVVVSLSLDSDFFLIVCEHAMFKFLLLWDPKGKECYVRKCSRVNMFERLQNNLRNASCLLLLFFFLTVNSSLNPQCFAVHFHDPVETLVDKVTRSISSCLISLCSI